MSVNKKSIYLITGGTGSFGNAMLKFLLRSNKFSEIRILSRDEKKQEDLRIKLNDKRIKFYIGDVRDKKSIVSAFDSVDYVFHAAALKQVPSCEFYPLEAVKTNILGTENVIDCSIDHKIKTMVLLSTDKAVYPINTMGLSKAIAEKLIVSNATLRNSKTVLCATRYGNVMGSRGSVIPLFIDQIKRNAEITITDPKMTRFLMSLDDSINLVFKAFSAAKSGDIFIKESPAVSLEVLVKSLKKIFNSNAKIKIIGTRHGEKLYETLISREELIRSKYNKGYFKIKADMRSLNYDQYFSEGKKSISSMKDYNSHFAKNLTIKETIKMLEKMDFIQKELS
tara:strand:+ start:1723 stop:2736 length:1014 start_codon:yes stop_codon:yes gene_type:complete